MMEKYVPGDYEFDLPDKLICMKIKILVLMQTIMGNFQFVLLQ